MLVVRIYVQAAVTSLFKNVGIKRDPNLSFRVETSVETGHLYSKLLVDEVIISDCTEETFRGFHESFEKLKVNFLTPLLGKSFDSSYADVRNFSISGLINLVSDEVKLVKISICFTEYNIELALQSDKETNISVKWTAKQSKPQRDFLPRIIRISKMLPHQAIIDLANSIIMSKIVSELHGDVVFFLCEPGFVFSFELRYKDVFTIKRSKGRLIEGVLNASFADVDKVIDCFQQLGSTRTDLSETVSSVSGNVGRSEFLAWFQDRFHVSMAVCADLSAEKISLQKLSARAEDIAVPMGTRSVQMSFDLTYQEDKNIVFVTAECNRATAAPLEIVSLLSYLQCSTLPEGKVSECMRLLQFRAGSFGYTIHPREEAAVTVQAEVTLAGKESTLSAYYGIASSLGYLRIEPNGEGLRFLDAIAGLLGEFADKGMQVAVQSITFFYYGGPSGSEAARTERSWNELVKNIPASNVTILSEVGALSCADQCILAVSLDVSVKNDKSR